MLGDESQADVRAYWTNELQAGRMTRGQVIVDLSESGAFRERSANATFVSTAYVEILQRTPDPDGYARWVEYLNAGAPMRGVIDGLLAGRPARRGGAQGQPADLQLRRRCEGRLSSPRTPRARRRSG